MLILTLVLMTLIAAGVHVFLEWLPTLGHNEALNRLDRIEAQIDHELERGEMTPMEGKQHREVLRIVRRDLELYTFRWLLRLPRSSGQRKRPSTIEMKIADTVIMHCIFGSVSGLFMLFTVGVVVLIYEIARHGTHVALSPVRLVARLTSSKRSPAAIIEKLTPELATC